MDSLKKTTRELPTYETLYWTLGIVESTRGLARAFPKRELHISI